MTVWFTFSRLELHWSIQLNISIDGEAVFATWDKIIATLLIAADFKLKRRWL